MKIINQKENHLFGRKEVYAELQVETTPKKQDVEKLISEKFGVPGENIEVKKISGKFGSKNFGITAFVYDSKKLKEEVESRPKGKAAATPAA